MTKHDFKLVPDSSLTQVWDGDRFVATFQSRQDALAFVQAASTQTQLVDIRQKLYATYMELADQASTRRQWEASSAFQYSASLALGLAVTSIEVRNEP
jgi:hypothetical protein